MKPVDQTVFTVPGGNCFSACVATLLELALEDVPYFMGEDFSEPGHIWYERFAAWLKPRGFYPLNFTCPPSGDWYPHGEYILSAGSPRGDFDHSVVAVGRTIVHDPHPSRAGLVRLEKQEATLLVPLSFAGNRGLTVPELVAEGERHRAEMVHALLDIEEWKTGRGGGAWATLDAIEVRLKKELARP